MESGSLSAGGYGFGNGGSGAFVPWTCENCLGTWTSCLEVEANDHSAGKGGTMQGCEQA